MIDPHVFESLETDVQAMGWENVSFEPDAAEIQQLDQELPLEWTQIRQEQESTHPMNEIHRFIGTLHIPEGDIDANMRPARSKLDYANAQEHDLGLGIDLQQQEDFDFGR